MLPHLRPEFNPQSHREGEPVPRRSSDLNILNAKRLLKNSRKKRIAGRTGRVGVGERWRGGCTGTPEKGWRTAGRV